MLYLMTLHSGTWNLPIIDEAGTNDKRHAMLWREANLNFNCFVSNVTPKRGEHAAICSYPTNVTKGHVAAHGFNRGYKENLMISGLNFHHTHGWNRGLLLSFKWMFDGSRDFFQPSIAGSRENTVEPWIAIKRKPSGT
jgi:hypothetical protein